MAFRKPASPFSLIVSANPLSARHNGHLLLNPLSPLYHLSVHRSQPMILLQHFAMMMGSCIGTVWHMVHRNASCIATCNASGIFVVASLVQVLISWISFFMAVRSSSISWCFFCLGGPSSSSEPLGTAYIFLLGHLQNVNPIICNNSKCTTYSMHSYTLCCWGLLKH